MNVIPPKGEGSAPSTVYSIAQNLINGSATTREALLKALLDEEIFATYNNRELSDTGTVHVHIKNPTGSGIRAIFYFGEITHTKLLDFALHTDITNAGTATALEVNPNAIGSDETSALEVNELGSFTSNTIRQEQVYPGTGTHNIIRDNELLLHEGEEVILELTSQSGGNFAGIRVGWWENEY